MNSRVPTPVFTPTEDPAGVRLHVPKVSHMVAESLRSQIVSGHLKAGDHLPPEAELLEVYRISRPTLREALRVLESEGIISVGRGARTGAVVLGPSLQRAAEYSSLILTMSQATVADLHQARLFLEPPIIHKLATKPDDRFIAELQGCVETEQTALKSGDIQGAFAAINRFHEILIGASGNPVLTLLTGMLHILSQKTSTFLLEGSEGDSSALRKNMEKTITGHQMLTKLMAQGKAEEAEGFWRIYMQRALDFLNRTGIGKGRLNEEQANAQRLAAVTKGKAAKEKKSGEA